MGKPFLVLLVFFFFIAVFANSAVGSVNLTNLPSQPGAAPASGAANAAPRTELLGGNPLPGLADSASGGASGAAVSGAASSGAPASGAPASGAPASGAAAAGACGASYTVRAGDTLSRIAQSCGVTLAGLLAANPSVRDPNLIHPGLVLAMAQPVAAAPTQAPAVVPAPTTVPTRAVPAIQLPALSQPTRVSQTAVPAYQLPAITPASNTLLQQMLPAGTPVPPSGGTDLQSSMNSLSTASNPAASNPAASAPAASPTPALSGLVPGGAFTIQVRGLPPDAAVLVSLGAVGFSPSVTFPATTDSTGVYTGAVTLPKTAPPGSRWQVTVQTIAAPLVKRASAPFVVQPLP